MQYLNSSEEDGASWLSIPLSLLGLAFSLSIVLIAIQYYIKKGLRRDVVNLAERKNKLDKAAATPLTNVKFSRLETQADEKVKEPSKEEDKSKETPSEKTSGKTSDKSSKKEAPKEVAAQQAVPLPPPPAYSSEPPKSILKSNPPNPADVRISSYFFPTDFLENILCSNSALVFPQNANTEPHKELTELPMDPLQLSQYTEYMRAFVHPSKVAISLRVIFSF